MPEFIHQQRPTKDYGKKEHKKFRREIERRKEYKSVSHFYREISKGYIQGNVVIIKPPRKGWKVEPPKK